MIDLESKRKKMVSNMSMTRNRRKITGTDYPSMQTKTQRQRVTSQTHIYVRRNVLNWIFSNLNSR